MSLSEQIVSDLTAAMKAQDAQRTSTLRMVKAAMMNRKIEKGSDLTDDDVQKLLRSLVKQRRDSIEQYEKAGRQELVERRPPRSVIETYLPLAATDGEIEAAVDAAITETGATSMKDMGKVMKAAQAALAGKNADGKQVSEAVKAKLSSLFAPLRVAGNSLKAGLPQRRKGAKESLSQVASLKSFPYNPQLARRHGVSSGGFRAHFFLWATNF